MWARSSNRAALGAKLCYLHKEYAAMKLMLPLVLALTIPSHAAIAATSTCSALSTLALPHARITVAQAVEAGPFTPPGGTEPTRALPAFCRVAATLTP